ncbi:MAG: hypothetical protein IT305_00090 [Chloroflexi bacterium]|nr:hypothetical protein [Chloroflexota bacterium]
MKLRDALLSLSTGQLHRTAASWAVQVEAGSLRIELVDRVTEAIEAGLRDEAIGLAPGDPGHDALILLAQAGGRQEVGLLARRLATRRPSAPTGDVTPAIDVALAALVDRGLVYRMFEVDGQRRGTFLVAPDEVVAVLRRDVRPLGPGVGAERTPEPMRIAECDPMRDLFVLASALRREAWNVAGAALASRAPRTAGQVVARLGTAHADAGPARPADRWRMHLSVGRREGWFGRTNSAEPDPLRIDEVLNAPAALLNALWTTTAEGAFGRQAPGSAGRQAAARLHADAVQVLAGVAADVWWGADDLIDAVLADAAPTPGSRGEAPALAASTGPFDGSASPNLRERSLLRGWLEGRWFWLGLVRWGAGQAPDCAEGAASDLRTGEARTGEARTGEARTGEARTGEARTGWRRIAVTSRLSELGPGARTGTPSASDPCRLGPETLTLVAPLTCDLATLFRTEPYLAYVGGGEIRRYRLTPASFGRGLRLGGDSDGLLGLVGALLGEPVPTAWQEAVDSWSTPARPRLSLESRLVLSAADAPSLEAALATAPSDAMPERVSDRLALVAPTRVTHLLSVLDEAGLAVDLSLGLRTEGARPGAAAVVDRGVAETTWLALALLERVGGRAFGEEPRFRETRAALAAILPVEVRAALERRATSLVARAGSTGRGSRRRRGRGVV